METGCSGGGGGGGGGCGGGGGGGDDVHGLKFGKKIYFEQDAAGGSGSGGAGRKGKGVAAGAGAGAGATAANPASQPRCQVEGCGVDLSGAKAYYCRHKVCSMHSKSPLVVVAGIEQRFCQQCSRFHQLPEFDQGKRSCRRRLLGHNERRRKPPPGPLSSRYGRLAASLHDDPGRLRSFLLDFTYPRVPSSVRDPWPGTQPAGDHRVPGTGTSQWQGNHELHHPHRSAVAGYGDHAYSGQGSSAAGAPTPMLPADFELPSGECIAGLAADSICALSLLSTQPWDGSTHSASHNRSPAMSTASAFQGNTVTPSVTATQYMGASSTWSSSRSHVDSGGSSARNAQQQQQQHHLPHEATLNDVHPGAVHHGQFGELGLALQGRAPLPNQPQFEHGSNSAFSQSSNAMNWSL